MINDTKCTKAEVMDENTRLRYIASRLQSMARRYCDGRMTYAVSECNEYTRELLKMGITLNACDGTLWAKDGMASCDSLSPEHHEKGHPLATGHVIGFPPGTHLSRELEALLGTDHYYALLKVKSMKDGLAKIVALTDDWTKEPGLMLEDIRDIAKDALADENQAKGVTNN